MQRDRPVRVGVIRRMMPRIVPPASAAILLVLPALAPSPARAASPDIALTIKNQAFQPGTLTIPAGQSVTLQVRNQDAMPAEFESSDLSREKVIPGGTTIPVFIGPLTPGSYKFFNDFHPDSRGTLVVVPAPNTPTAAK